MTQRKYCRRKLLILYSIVEQDKMGGIFNQLISFFSPYLSEVFFTLEVFNLWNVSNHSRLVFIWNLTHPSLTCFYTWFPISSACMKWDTSFVLLSTLSSPFAFLRHAPVTCSQWNFISFIFIFSSCNPLDCIIVVAVSDEVCIQCSCK